MTMIRKERRPGIDIDKVPSPCFVLEEKYLRDNLEILKHVSDQSGAIILCALKGYSMWSSFPLIQRYLEGATASSLNEARLCHEEMGHKAHLCCPVYFEDELDEILSISSHITFNSLNQFERFGKKALEQGLKSAIRINPEFADAPAEMYNPCTPGSRLGVTRAQFGDQLPEGVTGLHFHALCEQNADSLVKALHEVEEKWGEMLYKLEWFNVGGGHHITRIDYDIPLLIETLRNFQDKYDLQVIMEPGEAVGWQTGYLISTVEDIIEANGIKTAMLDVSFSAHMPDTIEMPYKPKVWGARGPGEAPHLYHLGGMTCLSGDYMSGYAFDQPLQIGQKLVFDDMIHYTMVKTTFFNGVKHPSIGIWRENGEFELIKNFGYQEFKAKLS
ncbi:MAG TPA: carboxynorspermidine decarboxylase [Cytophagales bacterium]|jgi:carboxynorspermidine decarboxylase|nr:carboxynorspermidine decarboxylase [Cytophagales bacterium]